MPHLIITDATELAQAKHELDIGSVCGQCEPERRLTIAWGGAYGYQYEILTCGVMEHSLIKRVEMKSKNRLHQEKDWRRINVTQGREIIKLTEAQMVERGLDAGLWPDKMAPAQRLALARVCIQYDLDPLMNEVMIYQGRLYITYPARLRKAQETGEFMGISTRPATEAEKIGRGYKPEDYVMVAIAKRYSPVAQATGDFDGWGVVTKKVADAADPHLPIAANPAQHAEKRAIARALKMAFSIPLPSAEDIDAEDTNGGPHVTVIEATGEIVEGKEAAEAVAAAAAEKAAPPEPEKPAAKKPAKKNPPSAAAKPKSEAETNGGNGNGFVDPPTNAGELLKLASARDKRYTNLKAVADMVGIEEDTVKKDPANTWKCLKDLHGWT